MWDTFEATSQRKGKQIFCCAPIIVSIYPFVVLEVVRTFGGAQTYMNRVFLCTEEEIAPSSESSSDQRGRETRETHSDMDRDRDRVNTPQPLHASQGQVDPACLSDIHQKSGPSPTASHSNCSARVVTSGKKATSPSLPLSVQRDRDGDGDEEEDLDVLTSSLSSLALGDVSFDMADMLSSYVQGHVPAPPHPHPQPPQQQQQSTFALLSSSYEVGPVTPLQDRLHQLEETVQVMNRALHDMQAALAVTSCSSSSKVEDMASGHREEKAGDAQRIEDVIAGTNQSPSDLGTAPITVDRSNQGLPSPSSSSTSSSSSSLDSGNALATAPPPGDETGDGEVSSDIPGQLGHPPLSDPTVPSPLPLLPTASSSALAEEPPLLRTRLATLEQQLARLTSLLRAGEPPSPPTSLPTAKGVVTFISQETQTAIGTTPVLQSSPLPAPTATAVRSSPSPERSDRVGGEKAVIDTNAKSSTSTSAASLLSISSSSSSSSSSLSRKEVRRSQVRSRHSPVTVPSQTTLHLPARTRQSGSILLSSSSSSSSSFVEYLRARDRHLEEQQQQQEQRGAARRESSVSSEDELQGLEHSIFDLLRLKYADRIGQEASDRRLLLLRPDDRHATRSSSSSSRSHSQDRVGCHHRPPPFDPTPHQVYRERREDIKERNEKETTTNREEGFEVRALIQQLHAKVMRKLIKKAQLEALQIKQESTNYLT